MTNPQPVIDTKLPLRLTVRVVILRGSKVCLCIKKKNGVVVNYNVPGGGVEHGDSLEETVKKEALEEVGIKVKNIKPLNIRLAVHHLMGKPERNALWSGTDSHYFVAEYDGEDKSLHGDDGDAMEYEWLSIDEAIHRIKHGPSTQFDTTKIEALEAADPKRHSNKRPVFVDWK